MLSYNLVAWIKIRLQWISSFHYHHYKHLLSACRHSIINLRANKLAAAILLASALHCIASHHMIPLWWLASYYSTRVLFPTHVLSQVGAWSLHHAWHISPLHIDATPYACAYACISCIRFITPVAAVICLPMHITSAWHHLMAPLIVHGFNWLSGLNYLCSYRMR